jgi:hypothetical protein
MSTAKQAMENMEYVRRLLEEKQAGFAASVELAVSFIHRQIERPEETMEMTLPPAMLPGTRWRRWCSGAALRGSHSATSADTDRRLK